MLLVHSIFQPYKKRLHNIVDSFIFFNLSLINGITVYNYHYTKIDFAEKTGTYALIKVQVLLAYLPLVYFTIYTVKCLVNKIRNFHKLKTLALSIQLLQLMKQSGSEEELPSRLENNEEVLELEDGHDYHIYDEKTNADISTY